MAIKKRYWLVVALILVLAGTGLAYLKWRSESSVPVRSYLGDNKARFYMEFLRSHLLELTPSETKARVVQKDIRTGSRSSILGVGQSIVFPDDEGSTTYTVVGIAAEGVDFKFESRYYVIPGRYIDLKQGAFRLYWFSSTIAPPTMGVVPMAR